MFDYVENQIEKEGILLLCKRCGNNEHFYYRETNGCSIVHDDSDDSVFTRYGFKNEVIECVACGHILWERE